MLRSRSAALVVVLVFVAGGAARAKPEPETPESEGPPPPRIEFRDGRLSVDATDVPTMTLLARIASVTGAKLSGTVTDPATVTVTFHDAPMRQAIDRIVRDNSFTLRYGADGALRRITLHGPSGQDPPTVFPGLRGRRRFQRAWLSHQSVALDGPIAKALGMDRIALPRLLRSVRKLGDRSLRRKVIAEFVHTVEGDANLRGPWRGMKAPDLATFMKQQTGPYAQEALRDVATTSRNARVRSYAMKALTLLPQDRRAAP